MPMNMWTVPLLDICALLPEPSDHVITLQEHKLLGNLSKWPWYGAEQLMEHRRWCSFSSHQDLLRLHIQLSTVNNLR